jgi:hypothetical protein
MINKEEAYLQFSSGWYLLLDTVYTTVEELHFCSGIESLERKNGMLSVKYYRHDIMTDVHRFILDAIEYKIERLSARRCEVCGEFGSRRTELNMIQTLCTTHYALQYSEEHPAPSSVAHQEPHTDY